jgi:Ser/Thr protein kinase RdoA (MazF antagonist)
MQLVPTRDRDVFLRTELGPWRTYGFVENTRSDDLCHDTEQAFEAARAFGQFQARLTDLDASQLRETIPRFFSSPYRMQQLEEAIADDPVDRATASAAEIDFALERRALVGVAEDRLKRGLWPHRVIHGDTKLNNILFDIDTGAARCIVDLDTCMPGYSLYDFGDLVRFTAATSTEDESDLDRVEMDLDLYRALASGYLEHASDFLTQDEVQHMPFAARLVTFTVGLRFLADHLAGDVYFKIAHPGHNLDRARVQFKLVESMERQL